MKCTLLTFAFAIIALLTCNAHSNNPGEKKKEKSKYVRVETIYGDMKIRLYNETPLHRDNFIKLVEKGFYDSLIFHRVIKDFMIQGGDPASKNAQPEANLGSGGPEYNIDAEIVNGLYHKKGALAAARQGDNVNPTKKSSGSQFYIVKGAVIPIDQLAQMEEQINAPKKQKLFSDYISKPENLGLRSKLDSLNTAKSIDALNQEIQAILVTLDPEMKALGLFSFSEEQKQVYSTLGGTPHLDQKYTVFGEIVEGLNVVDSIAQVKTGRNDRPVQDVIMKMKVVKK